MTTFVYARAVIKWSDCQSQALLFEPGVRFSKAQPNTFRACEAMLIVCILGTFIGMKLCTKGHFVHIKNM